jgi:hypothetical protein
VRRVGAPHSSQPTAGEKFITENLLVALLNLSCPSHSPKNDSESTQEEEEEEEDEEEEEGLITHDFRDVSSLKSAKCMSVLAQRSSIAKSPLTPSKGQAAANSAAKSCE